GGGGTGKPVLGAAPSDLGANCGEATCAGTALEVPCAGTALEVPCAGTALEVTESISVALICEGDEGAGASTSARDMSGMDARDGGGNGRPDVERLPVRDGGAGATDGLPVRDGGGGATLGPNGMVRGGGRGALIRPTEGAVVVGA